MKPAALLTLALLTALVSKAQIGSSQIFVPPASFPRPTGLSPESQPVDVDTSNSITNASGGQSALLLDSRVNTTGAYRGSVPGITLTDQVVRLSLPLALSLALRFNLGGIETRQNLETAQGRRQVARAELLPRADGYLFATGKQAASVTLDFTPPQYPRVAGPYHYFDFGGTLYQVVIDLTRSRNLRSASAELRAAAFDAKDARDLVVLAVCGQYLQVNADYARVEAANTRVRTAQRIYERAKRELDVGTLDSLDANRTQVQLQVEQLRLRSLESEYDIDRLTLGRLIGLPAAQRFVLADDYKFTVLQGMNQQQAIEEALRERDDVKAAAERQRAAVEGVKAAQSQYLPTLTVQASYDVIGADPTTSNGFGGLAGQISFPIFERPRIKGEIQQAEAVLHLREAEAANLREEVHFEVRRVFLQLNTSADQVAVAASNVDLAAQTLRQSGERLEAGVADTVEVVQAEQQTAQADDDYISAVFTHNLAKVVLARTLGNAEAHVGSLLTRK